MEKKLNDAFYSKVNSIITEKVVAEKNKAILKTIHWQEVAEDCFIQINSFFDKLSIVDLKDNDIKEVGAISFNWNQYGGDITIDFTPTNDKKSAFNEGYIMAESAIDNDAFFQKYFNCSGENSFTTVGDDHYDYTYLIYFFQLVIEAIIPEIVKTNAFQKLPRQSPCLVGFAAFDDELPEVFYTIE